MNCPNCNTKMAKSGWAWSGKHQVRKYKCSHCGTAKIDSKDRKEEGK